MSDRNLLHLLQLARHGKHPGASGAERQARKIVSCLLDNAVGIDAKATDGIADLLAAIQGSPQEGRETIKSIIG